MEKKPERKQKKRIWGKSIHWSEESEDWGQLASRSLAKHYGQTPEDCYWTYCRTRTKPAPVSQRLQRSLKCRRVSQILSQSCKILSRKVDLPCSQNKKVFKNKNKKKTNHQKTFIFQTLISPKWLSNPRFKNKKRATSPLIYWKFQAEWCCSVEWEGRVKTGLLNNTSYCLSYSWADRRVCMKGSLQSMNLGFGQRRMQWQYCQLQAFKSHKTGLKSWDKKHQDSFPLSSGL